MCSRCCRTRVVGGIPTKASTVNIRRVKTTSKEGITYVRDIREFKRFSRMKV
ncbi:unnamed protein product [Larinioides sclopetarius]|uniref:Uncharacterized protein n=1 Tax=Larinioides sclopetarius TaxID=280406 RepID=A0AAV1Z3G2_9ARAC